MNNITNRIKNAKETLNVSRREIMLQMINFYDKNDSESMEQMFEAYKRWELKDTKKGRTNNEKIKLAKKNFDIVARVADGYREAENELSNYIDISDLSQEGPISKFYRSVVRYNPLEKMD